MSGSHRSSYTAQPAASTVHSSSPPHASRAHPQLSMNLHELSALHHHHQQQQQPQHHPQHVAASASPSSASPSHMPPYGVSGHSYAPPLSPAMYDSAPRSAGLLPIDGHTPVDMSDGQSNSAGWLADTRMRSMSSDSAAVDFFVPSRGQSLDMAALFNQHNGYNGHAGPDNGMQHISPPAGGAGDGPWAASALYPPSSHTPTLSTASLGQSSSYGHMPQIYAPPPVRAYAAGPGAAVVPASAYGSSTPSPVSQRGSNGVFHSPIPVHSSDSFSPAVHPSSYSRSPHSAMSELSNARQMSPPVQIKAPPSARSASLLPLTIQLRSGTGKKKIWPNRTVLSSPAWSFSQLLFHAANLSTFVAVSVEGQSMSNESRLRDSKAIADLLAVGCADNGGSAQATKVEVVFDLPANVKSCTRLGCPNLLVNKANRRACNICQSQGADLFPGQIRVVHLPPTNTIPNPAAASSAAYLDLYLDQFEHWKFDGSEDGLQYIVFTDEATAQRVQNEMANNLNMQHDSHFLHSQQPTPAQQSMLQPVDPSHSYTIRMKSHFWMLQVKPLDGSSVGSGSKVKLYKKVGKPNQSRIGDKGVKGEKEDDMSVAGKGNSKADDSHSAQLHHSHHSHSQSHNQHVGITSPQSDDSEGSSVHSYPSLPALAPHLLPSSPESFSDSSSAMSSPALPSHMSRKRQLDRDDMQQHQQLQLVDDETARRDSVASDSSNQSSNPSSAPDSHLLVGFDDGNELCVSESSFYAMKNNKPVNAMMSVAPGRMAHTIVGAALTDMDGGAAAVGNGATSGEAALEETSGSAGSSITTATSTTVSSPPSSTVGSLRTPVVLVYRDMEAYEKERRRLKKDGNSRSGDKDRSQKRGGSGGGDGGGDGGRDDRPPRDDRGDDGKDGGDDNSQAGKRRRYEGAGSSQRQPPGGRQYSRNVVDDDGSGVQPRGGVKVPLSVMPELRGSLLRPDSGSGGKQLGDWKSSSDNEDEYDDDGRGCGGDKFGIAIKQHQEQRMVALPAEFADMLLDKAKMDTLWDTLKQMPPSTAVYSSRSKLSSLTNPAALAQLRAIQSTSLSTWFNLFVGVVSLVLILLYITGIADDTGLMKDAPVDKAFGRGRMNLLQLQSSTAVSTMTAISPVFASWALASSGNVTNSSSSAAAGVWAGPGGGGGNGGGGGGGNNGRPGESTLVSSASVSDVVYMCMKATQVSKAMGDWLLDSQGLLPLYANFGLQDLVSPAFDSSSSCRSLTNAVGFAHLRKLVCSSINELVYGRLIQSLTFCAPEKGTRDFDALMCTEMLDTLHAANLTATVLLGLVVPDQSTAQAFVVVNQTFNDSSPITRYLLPLQPAVRVVEMAAMGYYLQSSALSSVCTTYSIINHFELDFQQQQQQGAPGRANGTTDDTGASGARMMHPAVLLVVLIGSGGLIMIAQSLLFGMYRGSVLVYNRMKHAAS